MKTLTDILKAYSKASFMDEDGQELKLQLFKGVSVELLEIFERQNDLHLPDDFKNFLLFSNGIKMFGINIYSFEKMDFYSDWGLVCFHGWGNGDFDYISLNKDSNYGMIFFSSHSIDNLFGISGSFSEWMLAVINEIKEKGTLLHPSDYLNREEQDGLYKNVLMK